MPPERQQVRIEEYLFSISCIIVIAVIFIIAAFVIFFWAAYEQAGVSLTYFADQQTDRHLFGWEMPTSYFQSFPAIFVVLLAPVMNLLWIVLGWWQVAIIHLVCGLIFCITIIGIPFGLKHFSLALAGIFPFGKEIR